MASRSLYDLDPRVQDRAHKIVAAWADAGIAVLVTCTLRTNEEQAETYAQGRTKPGKIVTYAKPGQSFHNPVDGYGAAAMDVVPLVGGKPDWRDDSPAWRQLADIAKVADPTVECGIDWPARKRDKPHLQWPRT